MCDRSLGHFVTIAALVTSAWDARAEPEDEVLVRGGARQGSHGSKDPGGASHVIERERLEGPGVRAADVLRREPGVSVVDTGGYGSLSTASIRGSTSAQTPVYLAGVRLNDDVAGTADLSLVPLWMVERIEIYRGHAPMEADRLGVGGAIFFEPRVVRGTSASASGWLGSFHSQGGWVYGTVGDRRASALAGVRFESARNDYSFVNDRGTRFVTDDDVVAKRSNADVSTYDAWFLGNYALGSGARARIVWNGVSREQGVPGLALLPTQVARARYTRELFALSTDAQCGSTCSLQLQAAGLLAQTRVDDPLLEVGLGGKFAQVRGERIENAATLQVDMSPWLTIRPGARAAIERVGINGDTYMRERAERRFGRASLEGDFRLGHILDVRALASVEHHDTVASENGTATTEPMGRLSIAVRSSPRSAFYASVGRYGRVPTLGELYGISGAARGNKDLKNEEGLVSDLGVRLDIGHPHRVAGFVDAFVFARWTNNLIAYRRSSLSYVRPYNIGSARVLGSEVLAGMHVLDYVGFELSATVMDAHDTTTDQAPVLPLRSRLVLAPRAYMRTRPFPSWRLSEVRFEVRYTYQSNRTADPAGLVLIPEQGSFDLEAHAAFLKKQLSFRAVVENLFDQPRYDLIGYPLPGRTLTVGVEWQW